MAIKLTANVMTKPIDMREADFKREVWEQKFPETVKDEFFLYWSEPNKSNTKMKFEMEKTWHLGRRIARWAGNQFEPIKKKNGTMTPSLKQPGKPPENDFERLDQFLSEYALHPTEVKFEKFGQWYDFMKENKLLMQMNKGQVNDIRAIYGEDNGKCRCAVVQMTLDGFARSGWTIARVMEVRNRLNKA